MPSQAHANLRATHSEQESDDLYKGVTDEFSVHFRKHAEAVRADPAATPDEKSMARLIPRLLDDVDGDLIHGLLGHFEP